MKGSVINDVETDRIAALYQLHILDTPPEEDFDDIAELAAQICDTPVSIIAFEDNSRYWFKARYGISISESIKKESLCCGNIHKDEVYIIEDCQKDAKYANNVFVSGPTNIRFFAAIALINEENQLLGYLCVMDRQPRHLTDQQISGLKKLSKQVVNLLKLRLQILQLKKTKEIAKQNEELMNSIFNNSIDAVVVTSGDGIITQWNPTAKKMFGFEAFEVIGKNLYKTIIPASAYLDFLNVMKNVEFNDPNAFTKKTIEITAVRKDKSEFEIALGISPVQIKGERLFINFANDITERLQAVDKLDKQKEFYEQILNALPSDIVVFDPDHHYLFVNPVAIKDEKLRKFIIGKDDFEYAAFRQRSPETAQKRRDQFLEVKRSGKEMRWEDTTVDPNGNPITSLRRLFPVLGENNELLMVIGFGIDITDRKLMEDTQNALFKQLSVQNTQLIDFCNIVSHNLRAPLVNMSMIVNFLEETNNPDEQTLMIGNLKPVITNLHTTFNELVESIQIRQNLEITSEKIKLKNCLQRTLVGLKMEIKSTGARIDYDFNAAPTVLFPSKYLYSIFHNLISNALKYKSPKRTPEIQLKTTISDGNILLSVKDNGLGINLLKHKDNVFKIGKVFHRHPDAKGFGLFMTKTQVEAMEGRIWVESTPDEGSVFFIEFKNQ
jgi:PAS domain S-box-containing protein